MDGTPTRPDRERRVNADEAMRCARCAHPLTSASHRFFIHGRHAHTFMNPSGVIFDVVLYVDVPGADVDGVPESDTSWFAGTAWVYARCGRCREQVGWRYAVLGERADLPRTFFALITDAIVG